MPSSRCCGQFLTPKDCEVFFLYRRRGQIPYFSNRFRHHQNQNGQFCLLLHHVRPIDLLSPQRCKDSGQEMIPPSFSSSAPSWLVSLAPLSPHPLFFPHFPVTSLLQSVWMGQRAWGYILALLWAVLVDGLVAAVVVATVMW